MKKNVIVFGLISGLFITSMMVYTAAECYSNPEFRGNDVLGYAGMIAAFSFIFIGIRNYRNKYKNGLITFGEAFKTGLYISLIASTMYVVVWLIDYYIFIPGFLDQYINHVLYEARLTGSSQVELDQKAQEMADFKELYKNPLFVVLVTFAEVFPIGLVISAISALILRRK
ncbi:MAG: DUF4199 domain-containing protein [Marivirga sp.]|nr:DUF4199 domain-containing protein [Marivirga sp.]